jgi:hypothetical protein
MGRLPLEELLMDAIPDSNPPPPPDAAPLPGRSAPAETIEESRRRLAQLIGRLLARQWLRERREPRPDRRDPDGPALSGTA